MSGHALLDCGNERRLERFGDIVVDRPAPAARFPAGLDRSAWDAAALVYSRDGGWQGDAPDDWHVKLGALTMRLRPASGGQVGIFPEHGAVADGVIARLGETVPQARVLNLFAHTGLVTLRLAAAGAASVVHVDAAPAAVRTAKENAALSGLADAPVRWLVDDARGFMLRDARRGRVYDAILADPPAYGRAGKREWKLKRDLPLLFADVIPLTAPDGLFCLTVHSEGWDGERLLHLLADFPGWEDAETEALRLAPDGPGRELPAGWVVWARRR
ncbi:MAG: RsmD family RNA methyltransferase [Planctomycetaceae bacterium]|nr:RsmD family RNA methyltransferase [Planctomycetaceae bacterium]